MTRIFANLLMGFTLVLLAGCKVDLYQDLSEQEANEMLALLLLRDIPANKQLLKGGLVSITVEKDRFSEAVEVLRQYGMPRKNTASIEDLFPSGQLVTSPTQEQAKILFLKEQQLEAMLINMNGVIRAQVSVAESAPQSRRDSPVLSASVLLKYSPDHNLNSRETDVRALVQKGVPNLKAENISVVLEPTEYRYRPQPEPVQNIEKYDAWPERLRIALASALGVISVGYLGLFAVRRSNLLQRPRKT